MQNSLQCSVVRKGVSKRLLLKVGSRWIAFLPLAGNLRHHGAAQQRRFITFAMERKGRVEGASERASESLRKIETVARTFGLAISLFAIRYAKFTGSTASTRLRELAIRAASVGALFLLQLISPHFAKTVSVHSSLGRYFVLS